MNLKKSAIATTAALGLAICTGAVHAATISQLLSAYPIFKWEDNDAEKINIDLNTDGNLDVGDTLRGIVEIQDHVDEPTGDSYALDGIANNTLTAVFEIEVITKIATATPGLFNYVFGANSGFESTYGTGAMVAFFEDPVDDFTIQGCDPSPGGTCEQNVTDGTKILVLGIGSDPDDQWLALNSPEDTTFPTTAGTADALGQFNYALSVLFSGVGEFDQVKITSPFLATVDDGFVDFKGSGQILGTQDSAGNQATVYTSTSDIDLQSISVPEPTTLALIGAGLFGVGATSRRKKRASSRNNL